MSGGLTTRRGADRDRWIIAGMTVTAVSAAVSSFAGLGGLAIAAGWHPTMAPLLPLTLDVYAATATGIWLSTGTCSTRARRFAAGNAVGAIAASLAGNATYHAITAGLIDLAWPVVVAIGAVPAAALGLLSHLAVLRSQATEWRPARRAIGCSTR